ncbi:MAG: alpha/beta hydrolase [Nevskiaceae bacterium]|nr:MAG: alpha/beta hydrolase [Nevskiaceae bacterium]
MSQIRLSTGVTNYELLGPEHGPIAVLVHGISIPMWTWDRIGPVLAASGFRVLKYDMLGRGESAYPPGPYDRSLLVKQLSELLDGLGVSEKIHLVGFSFGGAVATNFTSLFPGRVACLALIAPFSRVVVPDPRVPMRLPLVGEAVMRFKLSGDLIARAGRLIEGAGLTAASAERFRKQVARPEFRRAFLSLLRSDALNDYTEVYAKVGALNLPTLLAYGSKDQDISRNSIESVRLALKPQCFFEIADADHGSILHPSVRIEEKLIDFLKAS